MSIEVRKVSKQFGAFVALEDVSLEVSTGELVALLSPSGSGKTTLLRVIAGLEFPDAGQVLFHGADATAQRASERRVGFVFQHYALFRHMSIFENVAFGLRVRPRRERHSEAQIRSRVKALLELVQLDWLAERYPQQLSGGQRQRVALARALAVEPKVLLLDEPFGALDAKVRRELRRWLRRLHDEVKATTIFVTHDQEEAMDVADRIVILNRGRVEQIGAPDDVYAHPASPFVYEFLGDVNIFHGRHYARPHDIEILRRPDAHDALPARVMHLAPRGGVVRIELDSHAAAGTIAAEVTREQSQQLALVPGEVVYIRPRAAREFRTQYEHLAA